MPSSILIFKGITTMVNNEQLEKFGGAAIQIRAFFLTVFLIFISIPSINWIIDPSGLFFNRDRILKPYMSINWFPIKQIIERNEVCDSLIFGTSRILIWDTSPLSSQSCKTPYMGKGMQSFVAGIKTIAEHDIKIGDVYITIERAMFYNQERFTYKRSAMLNLDYPSNYSENIFAFKTLLYTNTYSNIQEFLKEPSPDQYPVWKQNLYDSNLGQFQHLIYRWEAGLQHIKWKSSKERIQNVYRLPPYEVVTEYRDYDSGTVLSLLAEIKALSSKYNFNVTYIRAPIFIKNIVATNKEEFFDAYRQLVSHAPYYDFSYDIEYLKDPSLWIDSSHYNKAVSDQIIYNLHKGNSGMDFGKYVTKDNIEEHLKKFEENIYQSFINVKPLPPNTIIHKSWL